MEPKPGGYNVKAERQPHFGRFSSICPNDIGRLSIMPAKDFKSDGLPPRKISSFLHPSKEGLGVRMPAVYGIPCESGQVYIGQTCRSIDTRMKEHHRHVRLGHLDKQAMAKHTFHYNHAIKSQDTRVLLTEPGFMDRLIRNVVELGSTITV